MTLPENLVHQAPPHFSWNIEKIGKRGNEATFNTPCVSMISKELLLDLSLHTSLVEKKLFWLSLLSRESKNGSHGQQIMPELLNKAFSVKSTQFSC